MCFANTLIIIGFQFSIFTNEDEPTGTTCGITREPSFVRFMLLWLQGGLVTEPHGPDWQVSISMTADIRNSALMIILFSFLVWIQPVLRQGFWLAQFCKIDGGNGVITHLDTIVKISKRASFPFLEKDRGRLRGSSILRFQKFWFSLKRKCVIIASSFDWKENGVWLSSYHDKRWEHSVAQRSKSECVPARSVCPQQTRDLEICLSWILFFLSSQKSVRQMSQKMSSPTRGALRHSHFYFYYFTSPFCRVACPTLLFHWLDPIIPLLFWC